MHLFCSYIASLTREDPEDFVREVEVDVREYEEFCADQFVLGRFLFKHILWSDIEDSGWVKDDVLDADSQDLIDIYNVMFDADGELIPELRIKEPTECIVVLDRAVLHPNIAEFEQHLLEAALGLFTYASLVITWRHVPQMSDRKLAQLGFKKVAETYLIFRHSCLTNEYDDLFPDGFDSMVEATEDHEEWFMQEWDKPKRTGWEDDDDASPP